MNACSRSQAKRIVNSYLTLIGESLPGVAQSEEPEDALLCAPYAVLSHTAESDPKFNFGNYKALELFEFSMEEFIGMPSRLSAEPGLQEEREQVMREVKESGFTRGYRGVRISKSGRRFEIKNAAIWNLYDDEGRYVGQAAALFEWNYL
jgi:hypothetical protein